MTKREKSYHHKLNICIGSITTADIVGKTTIDDPYLWQEWKVSIMEMKSAVRKVNTYIYNPKEMRWNIKPKSTNIKRIFAK